MKKFIAILCGIIVIIFASCFLLDKIKTGQQETILALKAKVVPLTFELWQDGNNITIEYSFRDLTGNIVRTGRETLRGKELFIDCVIKEYDSDTKLAFPVAFYSDLVAAIDGINVLEEYNSAGFPEIFRGVDVNSAAKIQKLYASVLESKNDKNAFRSSPHILASKTKTEYQLVSRIRGGLEIIASSKD